MFLQRLYCIQHVAGANDGWQSVDITPTAQAGYRAVAFDVIQDMSTKNVNLAVAVTTGGAGSSTDLYTIFALSITYTALDWSKIVWNSRNNNLGQRSVTIMQLSEVAAVRGGAYPFVLVGTSVSSTSTLIASDYVVSLDPSNTAPWSQTPLSKVASSVIQVSPGHMRLPFGHGVFSLFQDATYANSGYITQYGPDAGNSCAFNSFPTFDANGNITDAGTLVVILLRKLGQVARGFTTLVNSKGCVTARPISDARPNSSLAIPIFLWLELTASDSIRLPNWIRTPPLYYSRTSASTKLPPANGEHRSRY